MIIQLDTLPPLRESGRGKAWQRGIFYLVAVGEVRELLEVLDLYSAQLLRQVESGPAEQVVPINKSWRIHRNGQQCVLIYVGGLTEAEMRGLRGSRWPQALIALNATRIDTTTARYELRRR